MSKELLFLDDERDFEDVTWINYPTMYTKIHVVRNLKDFVEFVLNIDDFSKFDISLDHDIQDFNEDGSENTGYTCVHKLVDYACDNKEIDISKSTYIVHSQNPIGRENILKYVEGFCNFWYN